MRFHLLIDTDNAAFEDNPTELADLLQKTTNAVRMGKTEGRVVDSNGNSVGSYELGPWPLLPAARDRPDPKECITR